MAQIKLDLDPDTYQRLVERAADERRPIIWQAEVELRRVLGGLAAEKQLDGAKRQPAVEPEPVEASSRGIEG